MTRLQEDIFESHVSDEEFCADDNNNYKSKNNYELEKHAI